MEATRSVHFIVAAKRAELIAFDKMHAYGVNTKTKHIDMGWSRTAKKSSIELLFCSVKSNLI